MPVLKVKTFRDVMNGHPTAEIKNLLNGQVVRRLKVVGDTVEIDALTVTGTASLDDKLTFKPWVLDRGNILFDSPLVPAGQQAKLCTQFDPINYPDGSEAELTMEEVA